MYTILKCLGGAAVVSVLAIGLTVAVFGFTVAVFSPIVAVFGLTVAVSGMSPGAAAETGQIAGTAAIVDSPNTRRSETSTRRKRIGR